MLTQAGSAGVSALSSLLGRQGTEQARTRAVPASWQIEFGRDLMFAEMAGITRRIVRAGGWQVTKRLIKPIPIIGSVFAFALAGYEIRKKGLLPGAVHVGLDVTPVIGTAKNVLEIFTGDLIPDKKDRKKNGR